MAAEVFYGEFAGEWGTEHDPFKIVVGKQHSLWFGMGGSVFGWANEHCTDEVMVDWGSSIVSSAKSESSKGP